MNWTPDQPHGPRDEDDDAYLRARPIARKRMVLLWLDANAFTSLERNLATSPSTGLIMDYESFDITNDDVEWARRVLRLVDKADAAAQRFNYLEAIIFYKKALELAPGADLLLMSVGSSYAQLGDKTRAVSYLERAALISPDNTRIQRNLAAARRM